MGRKDAAGKAEVGGGGGGKALRLSPYRKDVYALHFPPVEGPADYEKDVGLSGYDRGTGQAVPGTPGLRLPGDKTPRAQPFKADK